jgi:hypothetical protein
MSDIVTLLFPRRPLPSLALIRQHFSATHVADVREEVRQKLIQSTHLNYIKPGAKVAITASSRGIGSFNDLLGGIADAVRSTGGEPFLIPAMGSHGGATADGQIEILRRLGADEKKIGASINATMKTRPLGESPTGAIAHIDEIAAEADGVIVVGRPKAHPENREGVASGLLKMTTIGLGKQVGAQEAHTYGLWESIKAVPRITLEKSKILCGIAVVENAFRQPAIIEVVEPKYDAFRKADERLLKTAEPYSADLPFEELDLLVVDELGKDISGTGMDLNVIGKWRMEGGGRKPNFHRIVVLSLTNSSFGNGLGIGLADFTTQRFVDEFDWQATYVNLLTATEPGVMNTREGMLPLALASDREAIETGLFSSLASEVPRVCRIKNTAELDEFWVSEALLKEVADGEKFSVTAAPGPFEFDASGNLF